MFTKMKEPALNVVDITSFYRWDQEWLLTLLLLPEIKCCDIHTKFELLLFSFFFNIDNYLQLLEINTLIYYP